MINESAHFVATLSQEIGKLMRYTSTLVCSALLIHVKATCTHVRIFQSNMVLQDEVLDHQERIASRESP